MGSYVTDHEIRSLVEECHYLSPIHAVGRVGCRWRSDRSARRIDTSVVDLVAEERHLGRQRHGRIRWNDKDRWSQRIVSTSGVDEILERETRLEDNDVMKSGNCEIYDPTRLDPNVSGDDDMIDGISAITLR